MSLLYNELKGIFYIFLFKNYFYKLACGFLGSVILNEILNPNIQYTLWMEIRKIELFYLVTRINISTESVQK